MEDLRARYARYLQGQGDAAVDASWKRLQTKMDDYLERRRDPELFKDELYKWRLLQTWHGQAVHSRETMKNWLADKDNNLLSTRSYGSCYDDLLKNGKGTDEELSAALALFDSIDNLDAIKNHPLFQWTNKSMCKRTISDRDIAAFLFLPDPLRCMPYPAEVFRLAAKDLDLGGMTMPRWFELAQAVLLPLLARNMKRPVASAEHLAAMDVGRDADAIREGDYLCMLDVQDFIYIAWRDQGATDFTARQDLLDMLLATRQIILTGAPGTGKTYLARQLAYAITGDHDGDSPHVCLCQFHPSYDYTDFVEGLRPTAADEHGSVGFVRQDGLFKAFCKKAAGVKPAVTLPELFARLLQKIQTGDIDSFTQKKGGSIQVVEISPNDNIHRAGPGRQVGDDLHHIVPATGEVGEGLSGPGVAAGHRQHQ